MSVSTFKTDVNLYILQDFFFKTHIILCFIHLLALEISYMNDMTIGCTVHVDI
jgi:hypothetical protein